MQSKTTTGAHEQWNTQLDELRATYVPTEFFPPNPDWGELVSVGDRERAQNNLSAAINSYQAACELIGVGNRDTLKQLVEEKALHPWMLKPLIKLTETYENLIQGDAFQAHAHLAEVMAGLLPTYEKLAHSSIRARLDAFRQSLQKHGPEVRRGHMSSFEPIRRLAREMDANFASAMNSGLLLPMKR